MADILWKHLAYKTELQDYFQYEFYKLKNCERRTYMTFSKLRYTMSVCNAADKRDIFDDKALFNKTFAKYICRDWIDLTSVSCADFAAFVEKHSSFFAKARSGMFGKNAGKYDTADKNIEELYRELKDKGCIVEELIRQSPQLAIFNSTSVNTFRVVTLLCADDCPKVMAAVLRVGRNGKTADNFHHHGIVATIDVEKGIVNAPEIDREFKRYIVHPDSGEQIIGYKVPSWDLIVDLVIRAAKVIPEVRYVGWDVAVDIDGNTQLIEGNYGADPDVTQMPFRIGTWPAFKEELDMIRKIRPV